MTDPKLTPLADTPLGEKLKKLSTMLEGQVLPALQAQIESYVTSMENLVAAHEIKLGKKFKDMTDGES